MAEPISLKQPDPKELVAKISELEGQLARANARSVEAGNRDVIKPTKEHAYSGLVRALEKGVYQHLRLEGEIFPVQVDALWDDDWYEPVIEDGQNGDGSARYARREFPRLPGNRRGLTPWNDIPARHLQKQVDAGRTVDPARAR